VISPLLANLYLHYALDLWFERIYRKSCTGFARMIRYADDFVVCFQHKADAERFRVELEKRLGKFGLEVEPTKTKELWETAKAKLRGYYNYYSPRRGRGRGKGEDRKDILRCCQFFFD